MPSSVQRHQAPAAAPPVQIYFVTRYDPKTFRPIGTAVPVQAENRVLAAEQVCGFMVETAPLRSATVSVICIGEKPNERQYFRKA